MAIYAGRVPSNQSYMRKTQGPIRCFWSLDSKPKQQLRQPPQPPKPYISSKYTRKSQVSSKKGTDHQTEDQSYGVNGERILHLPWLIYPGDSNVMKLPDGRWLGFAIFGRPDPNREMIPLVAFHGTPGTRLDVHGDHNWSYRGFTPVIAPDRTGMGFSTYLKGHSVADHARDVILLVSDTKKSWNVVCQSLLSSRCELWATGNTAYWGQMEVVLLL